MEFQVICNKINTEMSILNDLIYDSSIFGDTYDKYRKCYNRFIRIYNKIYKNRNTYNMEKLLEYIYKMKDKLNEIESNYYRLNNFVVFNWWKKLLI